MASMDSYNVAQAKMHLSEILERVGEGEEILLTRRGRPIARLIPAAGGVAANLLGSGTHDPNINIDVLARDDWWRSLPDDEAQTW